MEEFTLDELNGANESVGGDEGFTLDELNDSLGAPEASVPTWESGDGGEPTLPAGKTNQWGGNLRNEGRKPLIRRDENGKVNGYSTTSSMFVRHDDGKIAVVPTVVGGEELSLEDAARHYAETGEHWGTADDEEGAKKIARAVHDEQQREYRKGWNEYVQSHWDDLSDELRNDRGVKHERARRNGELNDWNGNVDDDWLENSLSLRRDDKGKVVGPDAHVPMLYKNADGTVAIIPTMVGGKKLSLEEAAKRYEDTGEYLGMAESEREARNVAEDLFKSATKKREDNFSRWAADHYDELGDEAKSGAGVIQAMRDKNLSEYVKVRRERGEEPYAFTQVSHGLFLTNDGVLENSRGNVIKKGDTFAVNRPDENGAFTENGGTAVLMEFTGLNDGDVPVFKEVGHGLSAIGAMVAADYHISDIEFANMTGSGEAKVERDPMEQVRLGALAETGDRRRYTDDMLGTAKAVYDRLVPYAGRSAPNEQRERTRHLSNIYEGKLDGYDGKTDAEKYRDAARKAGLEPWNPLESLHPDENDAEFMGRIQHDAGEELRLDAIAKLDAGGKLSATEQSVLDKIVKGGVESGGYALEFVLPGGAIFKGARALNWGAKAVRAATMLGPAVPVVAAESVSRYKENITPEYGFGDNGEFKMVAAPDEEGEAAYKAIGGAMFDTAVEVGLEPVTMGLLRLAGKPVGWLLGKATPGAVKQLGAKKFNRFMASETGLALRQINRAYHEFSMTTGINSPFGEMLEENVQAAEKVLNLDGKTSEYKGLQKEWNEFYDRQFNADTQWDIFYGLIAQLGIGAAKSTAEGVARHMTEADVRRDVRMALARSRISDATIKTLTPEQQQKLDDLWRQYSADPGKIREEVKNLGISMRLAADELISRRSSKMAEELRRGGVEPEKFVIQMGADGKPAFQKMMRFGSDGSKVPMNAMTDAAHGVTIVDRGGGTFYVMNDWRGLDAIPAYSFDEAQKKANEEVLFNQQKERENQIAAQRLSELTDPENGPYRGRKVVSIPSEAALRWQVAQAVHDGKEIFGITRADQLFNADGSLKQPGAGGFHTPDGHIVVILDNVPSPAEMERVLAHEATGHEGVERATGRGANTVEFIQNAQAEGFSKFILAEQQRAIQKFVAAGMDEATARMQVAAAMSTDEYAREAMARYAQGRLHQPTWYEKRKHEQNQRRRAAGESVPIDQSDLEVLLAEAEAEGAREGGSYIPLPGNSGVEYFTAEKGAEDETGTGADETPAQPEPGSQKPEGPEDGGAQGEEAGSDELASKRITGYPPALSGSGEEIAEGTRLFEGGERSNRGKFYVQKDFELYGPFASREEAVVSALGEAASSVPGRRIADIPPWEMFKANGVALMKKRDGTIIKNPELRIRPNKGEGSGLGTVYWTGEEVTDGLPEREDSPDIGAARKTAKNPAAQNSGQGSGRDGQQPAPQAAEGPVEVAPPRGEAPDAGVVEPSNTVENLRDASDKASQALQDAESRLSKWLKDHPRQETEDGRVSYGNGGTVREFRELEAAVEAAREKLESAESEYRKAKRAEDAERRKSDERKKAEAKKRREEERKKWRDENPVTAQLEDIEKNVLLPAENELEDLLDSDASTNEQKAEAYRKVREARKVVDDFKNQHKEELEQEAANRKTKENADEGLAEPSKSDKGGQNLNAEAKKPKGKRGDNLRGRSYEDYAKTPDEGGTADEMGAELMRFARDNGGILKMPPKGVADPMADWINAFLDDGGRKKNRGEFIALFGMKPKTGANDAIAENMPTGLKEYVEKMVERDGPGAVADWFLETRRKYREWAQGRRDAAREERQAAKDRADEGEALESFDFDELAAARDAMDEEFANALGVVEGADEADYAALTPASLQIAKSGDTIRFDHDRKSFVFGSFDAGSGVLVVYDEDVAGMEGGKFRRAYRVTENSIEEIDDGQGNEVRADADRAGDEKGPAGGGGEAQGGAGRGAGGGAGGAETRKPEDLTLDSLTPAEQRAEQGRISDQQKKAAEREDMENRRTTPLKGSGAVNVQPEMNLGQTGQQDLFSPIAENEETPPAAKEKAAERPAEYLAWLEKYKMKDTDRRFAEWQRKRSARKPAKNAPASAPSAEGTTTPPKSADAPQVVKTTRDGESIRIVENGKEYEVELPDVKFPKTFTKATSKADWEAKMAEVKKIADELKKKAPFHLVINPKTGKYYANGSEVARQRRREVAAYEEAVRRATNQAFDEIGEYDDSWDEEPTNAAPKKEGTTTPPEAAKPAEGRSASAASSAGNEAPKRLYTKDGVTFKNPIVGKTGAKVTGYVWPNKGLEYTDKNGNDRVRRISDWDFGETSEDTGRQIIHQFTVEMPDGSLRTVSAESAAKLLGISVGKVKGDALKQIRKAMAGEALSDAQKKTISEAKEGARIFVDKDGALHVFTPNRSDDSHNIFGMEHVVVNTNGRTTEQRTKYGEPTFPKRWLELDRADIAPLSENVTSRERSKNDADTSKSDVAAPNGAKPAEAVAPAVASRATAKPAFKRGDRVFLKGAKDGQRVTFLKANADGTADVQVRTPGANRYAPEKVETRTVPMGEISSTGMKDTLTDAERTAYRRGVAEQTKEAMRSDPALRRIDAAYREAKTDAERAELKAQFAERVRALQGGVNFDTPELSPVTPAEDAAYMDAVRRGDMKTAQRIVDPLFDNYVREHGKSTHDSARFLAETVKRIAQTLDDNEKIGLRYDRRLLAPGEAFPNSHQLYQDDWNVEPIGEEEDGTPIFQMYEYAPEFYDGGELDGTSTIGLGDSYDIDDWDVSNMAQYIEKKFLTIYPESRGHVYIVVGEESSETGNDDGETLLRSPRVIIALGVGNYEGGSVGYRFVNKSADPVTRDDAGNVIPLSQRFNQQREDIRFDTPELTPADERKGVSAEGGYNPRSNVPNVRGGWTEQKILRYLKANPSLHGVRTAARLISEFDTVDELKDHMFYHGTRNYVDKMQPSMTQSERWAQEHGGGGYGQRYWGISVSKSKKVASNFGNPSPGVSIYPVVLAKGAKVIDRPDLTDAVDVEDHIVELWNDGVDAVRLGDWKSDHSEQELLVLNPRAICNIGTADSYRYFRLGSEENPLDIKDDAHIARMLEAAREYADYSPVKRFGKPTPPSMFVDGSVGELKPKEVRDAERALYEKELAAWRDSEQGHAAEDYEWNARDVIRFDTPELTPAEAEYVASEDKTPTEKVMREVFGMTNDEIATALKAAGMEPPAHVKKTDADMWRQVETLLSNSTYMAKLSRAVAKFPRPTRDYENVALNVLFRQRQAAVNGLERRRAELAAIPEDDMNKTPELRDELKQVSAKLAQAKAQMAEAGRAAMMGSSEQGRALRSNRALIGAHDYSYAGIAGRIAQTLGGIDKITPEMNARIRDLAKLFEGLDAEGLRLATERLIPLSQKVIDQTKNGLKVRKATERKVGDVARKVAQNYQDALTQIEVGAVETGGTLIGLSDQQYPSWGKWLRQIGEYHCFLNPNITEEEVIDAIVRDVSPFMEGVDANQVRDALTGFGHNYKQSRYDAQRLMNSLRNISRSKRQIDWMDETNTMPPATGPIRDEPTQDEREWAKRVRDRKAEVPDAGRDERRLKGVLDSIKTRTRNRIEDLKRAIETRERIPATQRKVVEDIELREMRKEKDELQKQYDELFGTTREMTDAQRIALTEKLLAKEFEHAMEDFARAQSGDFSKRPQRPGVTSETIEAQRDRIRQVREFIRELKKAKYEFGMTPEEVEALNARKITNREKAVARLAERVATGDFRTGKPRPPMTKDQQKRYDELGEQMRNGQRKLRQLREDARRAADPEWKKSVADYFKFFNGQFTAHMASFDRSAVMRQALRLTAAHPLYAARAMAIAEKTAWSRRAFDEVNGDILSDPVIQDALKYGLKIRSSDVANVHDVEMFSLLDMPPPKMIRRLNDTLDEIPLLGRLYSIGRKLDRAILENSERHYVTYINLMVAQTYRTVLNAIPGATEWQKREIAQIVNMLSGAGAMSEQTRAGINKLNDKIGHLIWSPNLWASQIQQFLYADVLHPMFANRKGGKDGNYRTKAELAQVMKEAGKLRLRSELAILALGAMLAMFWSDDDWWEEYKQAWKDGRWWKALSMTKHPVLGKTHIDLEMGQRTVARFVSQFVTGEYETSSGRIVKSGDFGGKDLYDMLGRIIGGKLSPVFGTAFEIANRKSFTGEPLDWSMFVSGMLPLTPVDVVQSAKEDKWSNLQAPVAIVLTILGAGGNVYDEKYYERAVNRFLEAKKEYDAIQSDDSVSGDERSQRLSDIREGNPLMRDDVRGKISAYIKGLRTMESTQKKAQKAGRPTDELDARIERRKAEILDMIREARR